MERGSFQELTNADRPLPGSPFRCFVGWLCFSSAPPESPRPSGLPGTGEEPEESPCSDERARGSVLPQHQHQASSSPALCAHRAQRWESCGHREETGHRAGTEGTEPSLPSCSLRGQERESDLSLFSG